MTETVTAQVAALASEPHGSPEWQASEPAAKGPIDDHSAAEVLALLPDLPSWPCARKNEIRLLKGAGRVLDWLAGFPGNGWQDKWNTVESINGPKWSGWTPLVPIVQSCRLEHHRGLTRGLGYLLQARFVLPSYAFLRGYGPTVLYRRFRELVSPEIFAAAQRAGQRREVPPQQLSGALNLLTSIVIHHGKDLDEVTIEDFLDLQDSAKRPGARSMESAHAAWAMMVDIGVFPRDTTLRTVLMTGQKSTTQLVDYYEITSPQVRQVLIRYLEERRPSVDYSTLRMLARNLVGVFWADVETHQPGIDSLRLPADVVTAWKERLHYYTVNGQQRPRTDRWKVLNAVRAFYLDIAQWALEDSSWAPWAVPSPVRDSDTQGRDKHRRATTAAMHQRVRERLPRLPRLVETAEEWKNHQADLLAEAGKHEPGAAFEHAEVRYRRANTTPTRPGKPTPTRPHVIVEHLAARELIDLTDEEDDAFWAWAIIEVLRHTGVRIEELLEITHMALASHRLPGTSETVPLLQIVPSKSNEERLLLVPPELASVLAAIIHRLRGPDGTIPLIARYDSHERSTGPLLPHLFQRRSGWRHEMINTRMVGILLNKALNRAGLVDPTGQPLKYTPHDFRRMFATEAVTGGLPIHIAAKILGHANINTTQAYTAVFQDELIRAYRTFISKRRATRPSEEYREPTNEEWAEFQQHFALRRVELGDCGRPYGTPCIHEHSCLRCPMLRVDPRQKPRLQEIIANLTERINEAQSYGWLGEVEGLKTSRAAAENKLAALNRSLRNNPDATALGMPAKRTKYLAQ